MITQPQPNGRSLSRSLCPRFLRITGIDQLQRFLLGPRLLRLIEIGERELKSESIRLAKESVLKQLLSEEDPEHK